MKLSSSTKSSLPQTRSVCNNENGAVLVIGLMFLAILAMVGTTAVVMTTTDMQIGANYKTSVQASNVAQAGTQEALHRLNLSYSDGNFIGETPGDTPTPGWGRYIVLQTGQDMFKEDPDWDLSDSGLDDNFDNDEDDTIDETGETYLEIATIQTVDGSELNYRWVKIRYKIEDAQFNNGTDNDEVVLYDQTFGYGASAPASDGDPVIIITAMGNAANNSTKTIEMEVTRKVLNIYVDGALQTNDSVDLSGNITISGFDHELSTVSGDWHNWGTADYTGDGWDNDGDGETDETQATATDTPKTPEDEIDYGAKHKASGHKPGIYYKNGQSILNKGAADRIYGKPWADIFTGSVKDPWDMLGLTQSEWNDLLASPDHTTIASPLNGITKITGDATLGANDDGEGILYVTGDLDFSGGPTYKGLIYCEGDITGSGGPFILGTVASKGGGMANSLGTGGFTILYSSEALENISQWMDFVILSWRQVT